VPSESPRPRSFRPLGYLLLTGYLFAKVRPVPITMLSPFSYDDERQLDRIAA
jgi:hypothetical protein